MRLPGTHIPGIITAGTFLQDGRRTFWDVHDAERAIVVELEGERYDRLVVEVEHPMAVVSRIQAALAASGHATGVA
ncbi:MAG TPA: hypothetical protein VFS40_07100 [Gemmatimonadales bacterium]|nr:hypothetical protein [Gemmatimonadales bacterium]